MLYDLSEDRILATRNVRHIDPSASGGSPIEDLAFSPDGTRLASVHAQDYSLRLWDGVTLEPLVGRFGHTEIALTVAFSPDGRRIVSGSRDYTVRVWDGHTGEPLLALRNGEFSFINSVGFSPDGRNVFSSNSAGTINVWRTGR